MPNFNFRTTYCFCYLPIELNTIHCDVTFLHSAQWLSLWDVYRYQPISHSAQWIFTVRRISVSAHIALCAVDFHSETYIGISPYRTLRSDFHCETYIGISPYRTLRSDFQCEAYIGISPYRTLAVVELQSTAVMLFVTWSCEKIQTLFIFRAIWENTAHVQWIRNKGSHIIPWMSAVFSQSALTGTPCAYLISG